MHGLAIFDRWCRTLAAEGSRLLVVPVLRELRLAVQFFGRVDVLLMIGIVPGVSVLRVSSAYAVAQTPHNTDNRSNRMEPPKRGNGSHRCSVRVLRDCHVAGMA
jgi:hypothetical protein